MNNNNSLGSWDDVKCCWSREQTAVEKVRQKPEGGRHVCVPAAGGTEVDGWTLSRCGPDGVPWLLAQYHMPDNTSQLRLINLATGDSHVLLIVGRQPPLSSDEGDSNDEVEEPEEDASTKDQPSEADRPQFPAEPGQAAAQQEDTATQQTGGSGQPTAVASSELASAMPVQPDAELPRQSPSQQSCLQEACSAAMHIDSCSSHQPENCSSQDTSSLSFSEASLPPGLAPSYKQGSAQPCIPTAASSGQQPVQEPSLPNLPGQDTAAQWQHVQSTNPASAATPGQPWSLGLEDEIDDLTILEDGQHAFFSGHPLSNPSNLTCWQVVSIPNGRITAIAWRSLTSDKRPELVGRRHIFVWSTSDSLEAFDTTTLQHRYTIDLRQTLREISGQELAQARGGLEEEEPFVAVRLESTLTSWVLVFNVDTGRLQASHHLPAGHTYCRLAWVGAGLMLSLRISSHQIEPSTRPGTGAHSSTYQRTNLTVTALDMRTSKAIQLAFAYQPGKLPGSCPQIEVAPGGCLAAVFQWDQGQTPKLQVKHVASGRTLHEVEVADTENPFPHNSKPRTTL